MEELLSQEKRKSLEEVRTQIKKLDARAMLRFLMGKAVKELEVERVCILEVLEELEEFRLIMGEPEKKHSIGGILSFNQFPYHVEAVEDKRIVQKKEPGLDPKNNHSKDLIYTEGITAWLILPLLVEDDVKWLMVLDAKWPRMEFTSEETLFCELLTDSAALLLERDKIQREEAEKKNLTILAEAAAEAVHRIKNSLTPIGGFARRLAKLDINEFSRRGKEYCDEVVNEVNKLEKLFDELLKFSQSRRTKLEKINLNEAIEKARKSAIEENGEKNAKKIKFDIKLDPKLPAIIGDLADIQEIFSPIFKNAVEAIKTEGCIFVKSKHENGWVRVSVCNTGGCVDEEIIHEIFNPFFTTKPEATGMGLATVRKIISAYDGRIKVENDKLMNTATFIVKLPVHQQ